MYSRITNVPESIDILQSTELAALSQVWLERKSKLQQGEAYQEFIKKLQREWAIETGIIERLYTWDRGVTEVLIEQGIDASLIAHQGGLPREQASHVKDLIEDQMAIVEGLFAFVKGEHPFTEHFIRNMQAQFTAHQEYTEAQSWEGKIIQVELIKGDYKKLPNNPRRSDGIVHQYCPPEIVKEEMERFVAWYQQAENKTSPETLSAWLHHRFTQIHPFQDGNGRVARALASLVFLKAGLFPLVVRELDRKQYIGALETADAGDLNALVQLFAKRQRDAILSALGLEQQAQQAQYAEQLISSAGKALRDRLVAKKQQLDRVFAIADRLKKIAFERMSDICSKLNKELSSGTPPERDPYLARVTAAGVDSPERHYFHKQIVEMAKQFGYFANLERYKSWLRLSIYTEETFEFVMSFHGYGPGSNGIMVASAFTAQRVLREEGGSEPANTRPASPDLFQFNYAESPESTEKRFRDWLEATLAIALAEWKRLIDAQES